MTNLSENWKVEYEYAIEGAKVPLAPGVIFRLQGENGKSYRFIKAVTNSKGETWIDCFGGSYQRQMSRAIFPERIVPKSVKVPKERNG